MQAKCIKDTDPLKTNMDQRAICEIKKRLQKAKRTLENIQKLNSDQWASLKKSVEKEKRGLHIGISALIYALAGPFF